jgi:hypothetical protein
MRHSHAFLIFGLILILSSCDKKGEVKPPVTPPDPPAKQILLKDITIPHLPSPYYHFEYHADSLVSKIDFASGFFQYDVLHTGKNVAEIRNNTFSNHDTLRYVYDNSGKLSMIKFINDENSVSRHVNFTYIGADIKKIEWDHRVTGGFFIDRIVTISFYADGNVKTITDNRPAHDAEPEHNYVRSFEQYDGKINVDDFSLLHDGMHDHLFLLQGFRLQKNNPKREIFMADGVNFYQVDYTYNYNNDGTPSSKTGQLLYTAGPDAGKRFETNSFFSYY